VAASLQLGLFARGGDPAVDPAALARIVRAPLDAGAWIEYLPAWVAGQEVLFDELVRTTRWRKERMPMYDRLVDVPRLIARLPEDGPGHPLVARIAELLASRYGVELPHVTLGYYRDGRDSVAWHGDRVARNLPEALVASVSLGQPRRFLLRPAVSDPAAPRARARALTLGWGDLLVMGGSCQRTWRHAVPKVAHAGPRLAIMFRPAWYEAAAGRPRDSSGDDEAAVREDEVRVDAEV
jgi:alkylated DNA repair dioxygenase AlkB